MRYSGHLHLRNARFLRYELETSFKGRLLDSTFTRREWRIRWTATVCVVGMASSGYLGSLQVP